MTRSINESCASREETMSLVLTSWIEEAGTWVAEIASEMTLEIVTNESVDSFPPSTYQLAIKH